MNIIKHHRLKLALVGVALSVIPLVSTSEAAGMVKSVIRVKAETSKTTRHGNGVVLSDRVIATNCHITNGAGKIFIRANYGDDIPARVVVENRPYDLCLIKSSESLRFEKATLAEGFDVDQVVTVALAAGQKPPSQIREIYNYPHDRSGPKMLHLTENCKKGDSGSGVFDDEGNLVGLIVASYDPDATCLALPVEIIGETFDAYNDKSPVNYAIK